jgi:hypothetical protein
VTVLSAEGRGVSPEKPAEAALLEKLVPLDKEEDVLLGWKTTRVL